MGAHRGVIPLLAWGALVVSGCGGRTSLESLGPLPGAPDHGEANDGAADDASDASDASDDDGGDGGANSGAGGVGPSSTGTTEQKPDCAWCTATFPKCVVIAGQRNCCVGPGPYDGPGGSCVAIP